MTTLPVRDLTEPEAREIAAKYVADLYPSLAEQGFAAFESDGEDWYFEVQDEDLAEASFGWVHVDRTVEGLY